MTCVNFLSIFANEFTSDSTVVNKWGRIAGLIDSDNNTAETDIDKSANNHSRI